MWATLIVPIEPVRNCSQRRSKVGKIVLPDAFFLQAPEEAFGYSVLLRRVEGDELLPETIVLAGRSKPAALEDQAVVAAKQWSGPLGSQCSESPDARLSVPKAGS